MVILLGKELDLTMPFRITSQGRFLRIEDTRIGREVFVNKATMFVRKNNSTGFMIKDGAFIGNYEYVEVQEPLLESLDELIEDVLRKAEDQAQGEVVDVGTASTEVRGVVQLSDSFSNNSLDKAPTANALKESHETIVSRIGDF